MMKAIVREHFNAELNRANSAISTQDFETAWTALQRAHILGQRYPAAPEYERSLEYAETRLETERLSRSQGTTHARSSRNSSNVSLWTNAIAEGWQS
jgi:hypothetical protein